jgi:hypothetical protein
LEAKNTGYKSKTTRQKRGLQQVLAQFKSAVNSGRASQRVLLLVVFTLVILDLQF